MAPQQVSGADATTTANATAVSIKDDEAYALSLATLEPGRLPCAALAQLLSNDSCDLSKLLLLDLRSFLSYNQSHIVNSVNVNVNTTVLKRCKGGISLAVVDKSICRQADKDRFKERAGLSVVLYDQTEDASTRNVVLVSLYRMLKDEGLCSSVSWLEEGFDVFLKQYPQHCKLCAPVVSKLFCCADSSSVVSKSLQSHQSSGPDEPVQILNFLFLAGEKVATSRAVLNKFDIKYVLNTAVECESPFTNELTYLRLDLMDAPNQKNLFSIFETAFAFINKARDANQRVLVHCRAGQSRSATIVVAYLMKTLDWDLARAYSFVQRRRPAISPNLGFMGQLTQYDNQLQQARPPKTAKGIRPHIVSITVSPVPMHHRKLSF